MKQKMGLHRAVMVLRVVGAPHGGAAGQGLAARDTRAAPGTGSCPGHGLSQAMGPQVEPTSARLWGPGDHPAVESLEDHSQGADTGSQTVRYWGSPAGWLGHSSPLPKPINSNCVSNLNIKIALPWCQKPSVWDKMLHLQIKLLSY